MTEIIRIKKPEELSIGQLYMFRSWSEGALKRGYCTKIEPTKATFTGVKSYWTDDVIFWKSGFYIALYNASVYRKFEQMEKRHKQEIEELLNPVSVHKGFRQWLLQHL